LLFTRPRSGSARVCNLVGNICRYSGAFRESTSSRAPCRRCCTCVGSQAVCAHGRCCRLLLRGAGTAWAPCSYHPLRARRRRQYSQVRLFCAGQRRLPQRSSLPGASISHRPSHGLSAGWQFRVVVPWALETNAGSGTSIDAGTHTHTHTCHNVGGPAEAQRGCSVVAVLLQCCCSVQISPKP
jgi:hypothetical protein